VGSKYPVLTASAIVRILRRHGFDLVASKGSHQKWCNLITGKQVIVPYHQGRDLPIGTVKSIVEGSGLPLEEWR
jgi:predicted RNA binding protein YcfA (HicA-like mRNA interferase family)